MELVSTLNLISLENEKKKKKKKKKKIACNIQTMTMNSFIMPHGLMRGQMGACAYMQTSSYM